MWEDIIKLINNNKFNDAYTLAINNFNNKMQEISNLSEKEGVFTALTAKLFSQKEQQNSILKLLILLLKDPRCEEASETFFSNIDNIHKIGEALIAYTIPKIFFLKKELDPEPCNQFFQLLSSKKNSSSQTTSKEDVFTTTLSSEIIDMTLNEANIATSFLSLLVKDIDKTKSKIFLYLLEQNFDSGACGNNFLQMPVMDKKLFFMFFLKHGSSSKPKANEYVAKFLAAVDMGERIELFNDIIPLLDFTRSENFKIALSLIDNEVLVAAVQNNLMGFEKILARSNLHATTNTKDIEMAAKVVLWLQRLRKIHGQDSYSCGPIIAKLKILFKIPDSLLLKKPRLKTPTSSSTHEIRQSLEIHTTSSVSSQSTNTLFQYVLSCERVVDVKDYIDDENDEKKITQESVKDTLEQLFKLCEKDFASSKGEYYLIIITLLVTKLQLLKGDASSYMTKISVLTSKYSQSNPEVKFISGGGETNNNAQSTPPSINNSSKTEEKDTIFLP